MFRLRYSHSQGSAPTNTTLRFVMSGGTGNADLYVRYGSEPTTRRWDCRSRTDVNDEVCEFESPADGDWYVMIEGYRPYSDATLLAELATAPGCTELVLGETQTDLSGARRSEQCFRLPYSNSGTPAATAEFDPDSSTAPGAIAAAAGSNTLRFVMSGGTGNADLYVRYGSEPTRRRWDCRPRTDGNDEVCEFENPADGDWYVMIRGYRAYKGVSLVAVLGAPGSEQLMTGIVRDRGTGEPIADAEVSFVGSGIGAVQTDASGQYAFTLNDLSLFGGPIQGKLFVGKTGYFEAPSVQIGDLSTQPSLPVVNDFTLLASGPLVQGTVRDAATGAGIPGATIRFSRNPMSSFLGDAGDWEVQTAADGSYAIDASFFNESGLTSGFSVDLDVNATGYLGATASLSFTSYPVVQDFDLLPSGGG